MRIPDPPVRGKPGFDTQVTRPNRRDVMRRIRSVLFLGFCAFPLAFAQDNPPETPAPATDTPAPPRIPITPQNGEPQPYEKVITKDAKTQKASSRFIRSKNGIFTKFPKPSSTKSSSGILRPRKPPSASATAAASWRLTSSAGNCAAIACFSGRSIMELPRTPSSRSNTR